MRFASIGFVSLVAIVTIAAGSYHYGYTTCYRELNDLNRPEVGNLLTPGDNTMIHRDLQRQCMDLETQLITSQREVQRLKSLLNQHESQFTQD
ncbi:hypothetical protein M4951_14585 [Blastopirellula sp. J2-11]|uniref:hypothetical protein n=1 Tax=Blastopirellula sp. J2-11 TaxID=2943192 RepID=UPI0021C87620|nr:hypothetical protein [Blastopirellula sp. J2-11]UUO04617.1 hypothetical protein M4951_14585 [Blastopirellula sp. J2-11]